MSGGNLVEDFGRLCRTLHRRMTQRVALVTKRPYQQLRALRAIQHEQIDTQNALAERLCIDAPAASRLVARLEKDRLLSRQPGEEDRRTVMLEVTKKSAAEIQAMNRGLEWLDGEMREHLTAAEIKAFTKILEKLNAALASE